MHASSLIRSACAAPACLGLALSLACATAPATPAATTPAASDATPAAPAPATASAPAAAPAPDSSAAKPRLSLLSEHLIGGDGFWDYLTVDAAARRLYLAHSSVIEAIDLDSFEKLASVTGLDGAHGVAVVPELSKAFATSGRDGTVVRFDTKTLFADGKLEVGKRPDAIAYEPKSGRVFALLGGDKEAVAIDPFSFKVVGRIALGSKPEFAVALGGKLYVNLQDSSELAQLDPLALKITARIALSPCEEPSGLAADPVHGRLVAVCENHLLAAVDAASGKLLGTAPIGEGTDGVAFDEARGLALASNGEGTVSVIGFNSAGAPELLETLPTRKGARTIAFDPKSGHALTVTAEMGPPDPERHRPSIVPGTLKLLVLGAP